MQCGEQLCGMALDASGHPTAIRLDEVHDEKVRLREVNGWDREIRMAGELTEHVGLEVKISARGL
ncbi:MAG TPA: hypothetical protein VED02_00440 [Methyloceanibacter sp.]|nr:hypothetical protein [Methyloceanibacter sp.]